VTDANRAEIESRTRDFWRCCQRHRQGEWENGGIGRRRLMVELNLRLNRLGIRGLVDQMGGLDGCR